MYLNLAESKRDGDGFGGKEPVYNKYEKYKSIHYWFNYGDSFIELPTRDRVGHHEGDWEHIAIKLHKDTNAPTKIQYFYHHNSCTLKWADVPKRATHPVVWIAKYSHGSYPRGATPERIKGHRDSISGEGEVWRSWRDLRNLNEEDWYGYAGAFGQVRFRPQTSGTWGPNKFRGNPGFGTKNCF